MHPEEAIFRSHVAEAPFQASLDRGQWGFHGSLEGVVWPNVTLWIEADAEVVPPGRVYLKFDLSGYPLAAPTGCPWDAAANTPLAPEAWPKGHGNVSKIFNPGWRRDALYAPCDRIAMDGHDPWRAQFPGVWWEETFTLVHYLRFIHACLNRERYTNGAP